MKTLTSKRLVFTLLGLGFVLLLCVALAASLGSSRVDILHVFRDWIHGSETSVDTTIVLGYRIPRIALAVIVGAGLATVGAVFQGILGNPLADPYILGVSGGASVGVALATVLGLGGTILGVSVLPATAFAGSVLTVALLYGVASVLPGGVRGRHAVYTLLLVGVVFNAFAMAFVLFIRTIISPLNSQRILFWLMGTLSPGRLSSAEFWTIAGCVAVGLVLLVLHARAINLLALGDDTAESLGIPAARTRLVLFLVSSLVVGAAVAASGVIGFVGLVVPHSLRLLLGTDHRLLVPASAIGGAAFLVLADLLSRVLYPIAQTTLPVGSVTAFVGAPLFFFFLVRNLRQEEMNRI